MLSDFFGGWRLRRKACWGGLLSNWREKATEAATVRRRRGKPLGGAAGPQRWSHGGRPLRTVLTSLESSRLGLAMEPIIVHLPAQARSPQIFPDLLRCQPTSVRPGCHCAHLASCWPCCAVPETSSEQASASCCVSVGGCVCAPTQASSTSIRLSTRTAESEPGRQLQRGTSCCPRSPLRAPSPEGLRLRAWGP